MTRLLAVKNTERQREGASKELDALLTEYQNVQAAKSITPCGGGVPLSPRYPVQ